VRIARSFGTILLSAWLILYGLIAVFELTFRHQGTVLGVLALAAGALLLFQR
jgi:hypothetical protein